MTRIIGGSAGGRRLATPRGTSTRPSSDRVREALFSAIESWCGSLQGLRFLDLYAGSGAVGLEAWSRGAGVVTLVEQDRRTAALITSNARPRLPQGQRGRRPGAATLARPPAAPYDVVFLDPPYPTTGDEVDGDLGPLRESGWLVPGAWSSSSGRPAAAEPTWPSGSRRPRERKYGETTLWYGHAAHPPLIGAPVTQEHVRRAVCPGSFDPVTYGHLDIVGRAPTLFDEVVVAVGVNPSKSRLFSAEERIAMLEQACADFDNVRVESFTGLLTDFCRATTSTRSSRACAPSATSTTSCRWRR